MALMGNLSLHDKLNKIDIPIGELKVAGGFLVNYYTSNRPSRDIDIFSDLDPHKVKYLNSLLGMRVDAGEKPIFMQTESLYSWKSFFKNKYVDFKILSQKDLSLAKFFAYHDNKNLDFKIWYKHFLDFCSLSKDWIYLETKIKEFDCKDKPYLETFETLYGWKELCA